MSRFCGVRSGHFQRPCTENDIGTIQGYIVSVMPVDCGVLCNRPDVIFEKEIVQIS
jgi:hypothetical protein